MIELVIGKETVDYAIKKLSKKKDIRRLHW